MRKLNTIVSLTMSAVMIAAPINSVAYADSTYSAQSNSAVQLSTNVSKLEKVTLKKAYSASTDSIKFSWNEVSSASGYRIYQYKDNTWEIVAIIGGSRLTTYELSDLSAGTGYKVRVCAYKKTGSKDTDILLGAKSDVKYLSTKPKSVGKIKSTPSKSTVKLTWGKVKCTGYQIYKVNGKTSSKVATIKPSSKTSYTVGSLKDGKTYTFKVRAYSVDSKGQINYGNFVSVKAKTKSKTQAEKVIDIVNQERAKNGLSGLKYDSKLTKIANIRVKEISGKFSHQRPDGSYFDKLLDKYHINYLHAGENIAIYYTNAHDVMNGWMNSTGHRRNILNSNFKKIGVGYDSKTKCWVQIFTN